MDIRELDHRALIAGELVDPEGQSRTLTDPARGTPLIDLPDVDEGQTHQALKAASDVFDSGVWRRLSPRQRGSALMAIAVDIESNVEELALLESLNVGKPITQARGDVLGAAEVFDYYGRLIIDMPGEVIDAEKQVTLVLREPVGVVAAIVPWNYPLAIAAISIAPALAAGCSVILKPASLTPLTALRLGAMSAPHLPPGVLNVVTGGGSNVGEQLITAPEVDQVLLTGGTETGRRVIELTSARVTRVSLELGGKSPTVILDDAPLDIAVPNALERITVNQGENCGAGSRLLIDKSIYDEVLSRLSKAADEVAIGDPQLPETDMGPMVSADHRDNVMSYIGETDGERIVYQGAVPDDGDLKNGFFVPLVIKETDPATRLWREEVFGPVLAIQAFGTDDEAVELANDTDFGLMATVWSGDRGRALAIAKRIDAGVIRVNDSSPPLEGPWGGYKMSGNKGRTQGRYGIDEVTELKSISIPL